MVDESTDPMEDGDAGVPAGDRTGPPWESEGMGVSSWFETLKGVLLNPGGTFAAMRQEGGLGSAILFAMIGQFIGGLAVVFGASSLLSSLALLGIDTSIIAPFLALGFISLITTPIAAAVGVFIGGLIQHLCLMLVGGAKESIETTFKVLGYCQGATGPLNLVPFVGGFAAFIWTLVCLIVGLAEAHGISRGKAALAVFLPMIVCCCLVSFVFMAFGAMFMSVPVSEAVGAPAPFQYSDF